jgi:hypothetical protein
MVSFVAYITFGTGAQRAIPGMFHAAARVERSPFPPLLGNRSALSTATPDVSGGRYLRPGTSWITSLVLNKRNFTYDPCPPYPSSPPWTACLS